MAMQDVTERVAGFFSEDKVKTPPENQVLQAEVLASDVPKITADPAGFARAAGVSVTDPAKMSVHMIGHATAGLAATPAAATARRVKVIIIGDGRGTVIIIIIIA